MKTRDELITVITRTRNQVIESHARGMVGVWAYRKAVQALNEAKTALSMDPTVAEEKPASAEEIAALARAMNRGGRA